MKLSKKMRAEMAAIVTQETNAALRRARARIKREIGKRKKTERIHVHLLFRGTMSSNTRQGKALAGHTMTAFEDINPLKTRFALP